MCEPPRAGNCVHGIGPGVFAFRVWGRGACGGEETHALQACTWRRIPRDFHFVNGLGPPPPSRTPILETTGKQNTAAPVNIFQYCAKSGNLGHWGLPEIARVCRMLSDVVGFCRRSYGRRRASPLISGFVSGCPARSPPSIRGSPPGCSRPPQCWSLPAFKANMASGKMHCLHRG